MTDEITKMLTNLHLGIEEMCKALAHIVVVQENILKLLKEER